VEDTAPYADRCERVFESIVNGAITAYTSVVTLTEALVRPVRRGDAALEARYSALLLETQGLAAKPQGCEPATD
jgi:hypothetical protein